MVSNITELCEEVRDYYLQILPTLPLKKQFHFLSRCHLWWGGEEYSSRIQSLHDSWWNLYPKAERSVKRAVQGVYPAPKGKTYREPYKHIYKDIYAYNRYFFMCLFDRIIFQGDAFTESAGCIDRDHHASLHATLRKDLDALRTLSTPAVNFITLSHYFYPDLPTLSSDDWLHIGLRDTSLQGHDYLDATIYLFTHVIIGNTLFYARAPEEKELQVFAQMLRHAEALIDTHYDSLSLDHKTEFLVCAALCSHVSYLKDRIAAELTQSVSPCGTYFHNVLNTHASKEPKSAARMEHTNILALMAFLER